MGSISYYSLYILQAILVNLSKQKCGLHNKVPVVMMCSQMPIAFNIFSVGHQTIEEMHYNLQRCVHGGRSSESDTE